MSKPQEEFLVFTKTASSHRTGGMSQRFWLTVAFVLAVLIPAFAQDSTSVNSKGLKTTRLHNRIEIQKQHAVDAIGDVSLPYNAFRSEARVVKAFTQMADGRTVELKKDAVRDLTPDEVASCQMYTDVHQLTFSMPALARGAIMDYEVEIEEKSPVMPGEFWVSEYLDSSVQVCTSRVSVTFPLKREVSLVVTNLSAGALATDAANGSLRTLTWEVKDIPALEYEQGMPPFSTVRAQVHLTSVKSWPQVEQWYAGLMKKQLREDDEIKQLARKLTAGLASPSDQIQALYRYASRDVRYVGVELGRSAYEPHSPPETMRNKYGDCKDKAALLVSLLNAIGIPAHLAIVRPNYDGPVNLSLPGPAQFNHAIVYVPRDTGDLWIDATQPFGEVAEHGYHLDDIDALVIGLAGRTFVHVPAPDETHSVHRVIFDLDVHYGGLCTVHEIQEYVGRAAIAERERRARLDTDKVRKQLEHNFNSEGGYTRLLNYSFTSPTNDLGPVRVVVDYDSDTFLTGTKSGFSLRFDAASLRDWLDVPRPDPASVRKRKRAYPWVARMAHTEEIICRLHLPEGYELSHKPIATRKELPHGRTELAFDESSGTPTLTLRVIRRPARLEPGELPAVAQHVDQAIARVRASLDLEDAINELIREHHYVKAEASVVDAVRRNTNSVDALLRLGLYYKATGRVYQSRLAFEKVVALAPRDPRGYEALANAYSGYWGIPGEGFDRKSILGIYDRALTNVPGPAWAIHKKAELCLIDDRGRGDSTNRLDEAEGYFRQLLKEDAQNYQGLFGLGEVNRLRGNYDEAEDFYRKAAHAKPGRNEPLAGIWISMAYAGREEEAWNAISAYYGTGQQLVAEAARVATLLTASRHYSTAASLYDRLVESSARPEVVQKLARQLRKTEKLKRDDYATFYDDTSPEGVAKTFLIAGMMADTNRVLRCLSPAVSREAAARSIQSQQSIVGRVAMKMDMNFLVDSALASFEITKRTLDNGDIEVKFDASKSASAGYNTFGNVMTLQVQQASNRWQVITTGTTELDCATFGRLALDALDRGDIAVAVAHQTRIADIAVRSPGRRAAPPFAEHLQEIAFTNDVLRVKAWAGMSLVRSADRADIARGVACLEQVAEAYPDDAQVKLAVAYAHDQTANVKKAAAVLGTINIARLAAPDQLGQLAWMLIRLEQLETGDRVIARLREVAPNDEQLLAIQSFAQTCRAQYAEAAATNAKLRERSKLDRRTAIRSECFLISASHDQTALRELIDRWRESSEKSIVFDRSMVSTTCLGLGLNDEAAEQIAMMISEGGQDIDALAGYANVAIARGDIAEARDLASRAERVAVRTGESDHPRKLCSLQLALGDYAKAAHGYRDRGLRDPSDSSGYSLCMSAIASRLAGDKVAEAESLKLALTMQGDSDWPRLALQYVKGEISDAEFRRAPERTTVTPLKRASRECEVNCIIGLVKESKHDLPGALAAYQASVATKSAGDVEYFIAKQAVHRLQNSGK
jgi:tetratricopeptide (TPR) repeat protein